MSDANDQALTAKDQQYIYSPLNSDKKCIRLLTLLPADDPGAWLQCNIETAEITWRSSFDALSYTWGAPGENSTNPLYLNGHPTTISRNLDAALRALRSSKPLVLWVDAVCINQNDDDEKSKQVAMMDVIYEKANRTLVWLGDESEDSNVAMTKLGSVKSKKDLADVSDNENVAIGHLLNRPWFSRVWVVQEFGLAKDVIFHCGPKSFSWSPIEKVSKKIIAGYGITGPNKRESKKIEPEVLKNLSCSQVFLRLLMDRRGILKEAYGGFAREKSFQHLLEQHIHLQATVPHDRIYGLLALGKHMKAKMKHHPPIAYAESAASVTIAWARWMIEDTNRLNILFACQKTKSDPDLPSWVPSWKARDEDSFIPNFSSAMLTFYASSKLLIMHAENNKQIKLVSPQFSFSEDSQLLTLLGKRIAVLDATCTFKEVEPDYYRKLLGFLPPGYISGEEQTLWNQYWERETRKSLLHVQRINGVEIPFVRNWQLANDYAAAQARTPARLEKLKYVVEKNRKKFINKGGCEGLVPKDAQAGDVLCLFRGMETPFVIRPVGERYQIIGECFVDGYMKGRKSMGEKTTFVLC